MDNRDIGRKAEISLMITEYLLDANEVAPIGDALIVGRRSEMGTDAVKKLVELVAPEKFEVIKADHTSIDSIIIRKTLLSMVQRDKLLPVIIGECGKVIHDSIVLKTQISIVIHVNRMIDI